MIEVYDRVIEGIPVLEVVNSEQNKQKLPTVIFYHGWTNVKEAVLVHGYEIARKGFRVLLPEAKYHGARNDGRELEEHMPDFWKIVKTNIAEYPILIGDYIERGLTDGNRVGVTGLSMGGITTCGLMATYDSIKAADCLMGSPTFIGFTEMILAVAEEKGYTIPIDVEKQLEELKPLDLAEHPEKIAGRPFHFWHGTKDPTVPYQPTYDFYKRVKKEEYGQSVTFTTTDDEHRVPYVISQETADFFAATL